MSATTADGNSEKPLSGLRVIDLSRVIAGPYCGQVFADMGADVVKVETPDGDENRRWPPLDEDGSSNFECVNRGKLGLTIDLKAKAGQQVLDRLLRSADILIHNYLPETATKLGIEEGGLRERFPRLIVCTITGYGRHGPLANKPGYDTFLQAFSGAMSTTGYPDLPPVRVGLSFIDISTGLSAYAAVMTAA